MNKGVKGRDVRTIIVATLAAGGWSLGAPLPAAAQSSVQLGTGVQYSSGDYGSAEDTTILEVPFTARLKTGNWSFRARVPISNVEGPGGVVPGEDDGRGQRRRGRGNDVSGGDRPDEPDEDVDLTLTDGTSASGLGDVSLSASYSFDVSDNNYLDLTGRVTLPTGDEEEDLGVGETDYVLSAEFGQDFNDGGLYAAGGYRVRGGDTREDGALASIGGYGIMGTTITGVEFNWSEPALATSDDALGVTGYTSFRLNDDIRLSLFAEAGLSENMADYGAGVGLTWRTNFRRPFQRR